MSLVIIPTYNEKENIENIMRFLISQWTFMSWSLMMVRLMELPI